MCVRACVCVCVCVRVRACVRACLCVVCVCDTPCIAAYWVIALSRSATAALAGCGISKIFL